MATRGAASRRQAHPRVSGQSRTLCLVEAVLFLVLAYILGSRALNTGSYWEYSGTLILLILTIWSVVRVFQRR